MTEKLSTFISDPLLLAAILFLALVVQAWVIWLYLRARTQNRALVALLDSREKPLLFYDERDRLVYHSTGLLLFNRKVPQNIRKLQQRPQPGAEIRGEIVIDSNRYRFVSSRIEYKPGTHGTLVLLEYLNAKTAGK